MSKLTEDQINAIIELLKEGKPLPDDYKHLLFEGKQEYELVYAGKEREEDILAETMMVPLQSVKIFGEVKDDEWHNILIFGDNLQVLQTLRKDEWLKEKIRRYGGIKLVYIDPPFATRQEFRGSQDQKAYQDKLVGAQFLEFLRRRLIFLRELLARGGAIYVHLDWKKGHYIKTLLDEIFGEYNFRNEIAVSRIRKNIRERERVKSLNYGHDTIYFYANSEDHLILPPMKATHRKARWHAFDAPGIRTGMDYELFGHKPPRGRHWMFAKERADAMIAAGTLRPHPKTGNPQYLIEAVKADLRDTIWDDIVASSFQTGFPTEKSEKLLATILEASSAPGDIVLDCFAGSGTTLAVAEKLGRRWIGIDSSKLATYTMQKRLLNLKKEIGNKGKPLKPKSFVFYQAGLYDYKKITELPWEEYRKFALQLFQCRDEKHLTSGIELDGYLGRDSVLVFNWKKNGGAVMDRGFIGDLHNILGDRITRQFFIVAPAASVTFLEDYIQHQDVKYYVLRIPYSIIEEIHKKGFTSIKQPKDEQDVNDVVEAVGFDFVYPPEVECEYYLDDAKEQLELGRDGKEAVIKIKKFTSTVISRKPIEYKNLETLSMTMVDYDHDGKVFDMDEYFFAEELRKNDYEIRFNTSRAKGKIMITYMDIFGNEKREIKTLGDFRSKKRK